MVTPGKDVTLYIPADTPPEVIAYLNRLKAEGYFSQGIMEILSEYILRQSASAELAASEEASMQWDDQQDESIAEESELPEPIIAAISEQNVQKPFSPEDIIRQATRNAGKLLHDRQP